MDIVFDEGQFYIYHPPMEKTELTLNKVLDFINNKDVSIWLDGKNIDDLQACEALSESLRLYKHKINLSNVLVEFPPKTNFSKELNNKCLKSLREDLNINISYYIDSNLAIKCESGTDEDCLDFKNKLDAVISNHLISDVSYDKSAAEVMDNVKFDRFHHNTWSLKAHEFNMQKYQKMKRVIYENHYL
jgi:hypothetical protein